MAGRFLITLVTYLDHGDHYHKITLTLWLPHVLSLLASESLTAPQRLSAARLFNMVGLYAFTQIQYELAELLYRRALSIREERLSPSDLEIATSLNNLTLLYYVESLQGQRGKDSEATFLCERALSIREERLGTSDPDTASSLNDLALLYSAQDKYNKAEPLHERALAIREQRLGSSHPSTAQSLNNLAALYQMRVKYAEERRCTASLRNPKRAASSYPSRDGKELE